MLTLALGAEEAVEADDLLCSRNARPQKALVGRAQWRSISPHPCEIPSATEGPICEVRSVWITDE